jgi:DNA-binding NtrC family response regulator
MATTLTEGFAPATDGAFLTPMLVRVWDADAPLAPSTRVALADFDQVILGRGEQHRAVAHDEAGARQLVWSVADRWMSSAHAKLSKVMNRWLLEDSRSKNGVRHNGEPLFPQRPVELTDGDVFELGRSFFLFRDVQRVPPNTPKVLESDTLRPPSAAMATLNAELAEVFAQLATLAPSAVSLALRGPSGSGKEVLARAIHELSGRSGAFIAVNCGALPDDLVESELFGHRRGAFSGAVDDRVGLFRAANAGTLLLDEVGDLPLEAQPALLRVLQERLVTPVGGTTPVAVDVRVLSATHRDLEVLAKQGLFRDDVRARLSGYEATLPALLERREDLGVLMRAVLLKLGRLETTFTLPAARALLLWHWPLNVRELEKTVEAAVALAGKAPVDLLHLPVVMRELKGRPRPAAAGELDPLDEERRAKLISLLREHHGNISAVARAMGKARMQVQRWLARYALDPQAFREP